MNERDIFIDAFEIESHRDRQAFLDQACGSDTSLRERVEALLLAHDKGNSFLDSPPGATLAHPIPEAPGTLIGRYKLLEEIGEGGMGVVYMAEQREPVRRKVALKVVKPGTDTREVIARFEAERQALAMMDHPNIAKVLDGGATESGRPYFVMELVQGIPITDYCDRDNLTTRQRLSLFVLVCRAVQHAHQKGIIHRDVKPSNVMVTLHDGVPVPKIIDFGIAKAIHQPHTEKTFFTGHGRMMGTPMYMSPEQAEMSGLDVDTRSDIYSLGVLLYELLTGSTPFDQERLREAGFDEVRRVIREEEPPRPSHRVSTLAAEAMSTITAHRGVDSRSLGRLLTGDLDWIVMKALQKDRTQRYESASALAADVERHLANEPIQARPPTLADRAAKWARRHRAAVWSVAAVVAIASVAGGSLFWTGYRRAAQLERDAGEHLAAATAFLGSGNYIAADRELADARGHLEAAGYRQGPLQEKMAGLAQPLSAVKRFEEFQAIRQRIHSEMYALDRDILDQAQEHCRTALDLFGVFETDSWKSQADFENLDKRRQAMLDEEAVELLFIWARLQMGKSDAQPAAERAAGHHRAIEVLGKIESFHPRIPAVALWMADSWEAAGDKEAAAEARAKAEGLRPTTAMDHFLLGEYHARHGQQEQALASYWQALAQQPDHYLSLLAAGAALGELKEYRSAEAMLTGAIAMNPNTIIAYVKRATARWEQGKVALALADTEKAKKLDPELALALTRQAEKYRWNFQFGKAIADYSEAIRLDPTAAAYAGRGAAYLIQEELDKALADYNEAIRLDPGIGWIYAARSQAYDMKGETLKALADANEGIRLEPKNQRTYLHRGMTYARQGELDKALADLNEAIRLDPKDNRSYPVRADIYMKMGEREKALADYKEAIRLEPGNAWGHLGLADLYCDNGDLDKALAEYNEMVRVAPEYEMSYTKRGNFYRARGDFDKALVDYNEGIRLAPKLPGVWSRRASFYSDRGDFDRALADYGEAIRLDPGDGVCYAERGNFYLDRREFDKAAADYDRAVELEPSSAHYYKRRAKAHFKLKHFDKALENIAKAVELNPGDVSSLWWIPPAEVAKCPDERLRQGLLELADKTIEKTKGTAEAYAARGILRHAFGRQEEALADFRRAVELQPKEADVWYLCALGLLAAGCSDDYRKDCGEMLQRFGQTDKIDDAFWVAWTCFLAPDATRDWATAVALAEKAAKSDPKSSEYLNTLGAVLYRAGRFDEAIQRLTEADRLAQPPSENRFSSPAYTWFFLAMAHHRLGHLEEAKKWLDKAVAWTDKIFVEADQGTADVPWNRRLTLKLLRDEAEALLKSPPATPPSKPAATEKEKTK